MEFLKNLISSFLGEGGGDLLSVLSNFLGGDGLNKIMPFLENIFSAKNKNPTENSSVGDYQGLSPVTSFADKDIIVALNGYLGD